MPDTGDAAPTGDQQEQQQTDTQQQEPATGDEPLGEGGKKALEAERARAADLERQFKAAQKELEQVRRASMSESEKAIAEAKAAGRVEAASEFGRELARERFDAIAGRRNPDFDTAKALEYVDLSKFLGEDGRPDPKAITAAVERLVPEAQGGAPSYDGGPRGSAPKGADMNQLLRQAAGRA